MTLPLLTSWVNKLLSLGEKRRSQREWPVMKDEGSLLSKPLGRSNFILNGVVTGKKKCYLRRFK